MNQSLHLLSAAIYGYSFCKAARQAFKLLASNALRVFAINSIGDFVLFLAKAAIIVATVFIGIEFMKVLLEDSVVTIKK